MTTTVPQFLFAWTGGLFLGLFFFAGLWLTVRRLPESRHPSLLTAASFLGRTALVLLGFWALAGTGFERWVAVLAGFVTARFLHRRQLSRGHIDTSQEGLHGSHSN